MGKIIAVGNLKGGTGKSTIAVNLACRLAEKERSVVLIDADPQGTAAAWLRDGPPQGLNLISLPLGRAHPDAWAARISGKRGACAQIVIDLPPQAGDCFEAALGIADLLVVPLTLSEVDLHATAQALAVLHRMRGVRGGRPACLLVPSKVDRRTSLGRQARGSLAGLGWQVGPALGQRAAHGEAFKAAKWIGAHAPDTAAHREVRMLVDEVEDQLARCPEPVDDHRPIVVAADALAPAAAGPKSIPAAPAPCASAWWRGCWPSCARASSRPSTERARWRRRRAGGLRPKRRRRCADWSPSGGDSIASPEPDASSGTEA